MAGKTAARAKAAGIPSEFQEQSWLAEYLRSAGLHFHHSANEGFRSVIQGRRLKQIGMRPGFPDLLLFTLPPALRDTTTRGVAIEMKRQNGGRLTPQQRDELGILAAHGWLTYCAHGCHEAIAWLREIGYPL